MSIADLLPRAQSDAISYRELSEMSGLSPRELRQAIRRERREGRAILTSREPGRSGVWLWDGEDAGEFNRCYMSLVSAGCDLLETARQMKERCVHG